MTVITNVAFEKVYLFRKLVDAMFLGPAVPFSVQKDAPEDASA